MLRLWIRRLREWRRRRKTEKQEQLVEMVESTQALADPRLPSAAFGTHAGIVVRRRQRARFGLKAYVRWQDRQEGHVKTAVWFKGSWPKVGSLVIASGGMGWGPHHREPVFYGDVLRIVPRRVMAKYRRICARERRQRRREQRRLVRVTADH